MIHEQMINRRLLVIDDEENMCHMLKVMLERHGYEVQTETSAERALNRVEQQSFSFILCDVRMPGMDGLGFIRAAADKLHDCSVIMMSAYGSVESAIEAMKAGAYDFISKPFKTDEVLLSLKKAEEREQLKRENLRLKSEIDACRSTSLFEGMVGESAAIRRVFDMAKQVANYATTVLITGESGTGKELVARGLHHYSARNKKPFVAVNCGSIPENLLESELFGHEKGSFTGAD
ncbi:MAG: sigma-54-dependent Fis family transcriptional regulator, partial [Desulfofustis sp.]|nr:sigma-54-dependent Fis family transcriptional regulator [Desulfofustis sp.]